MLHLLHYTRFAYAAHTIDEKHLLAFLQYSVQYLVDLPVPKHETLLLWGDLSDYVLLGDVVWMAFGDTFEVIALIGVLCITDLRSAHLDYGALMQGRGVIG